MGILHTVLKVVYTLYIVPTGLGAFAGFLSIDIMSLTGQSVNRQMKDAKKWNRITHINIKFTGSQKRSVTELLRAHVERWVRRKLENQIKRFLHFLGFWDV